MQPANKFLCRPPPAVLSHVAVCTVQSDPTGLNSAVLPPESTASSVIRPLVLSVPSPGLGFHQESIGSWVCLQDLFSRELACDRRQLSWFLHVQCANNDKIFWWHPAVIWSRGNLSALCNWDCSWHETFLNYVKTWVEVQIKNVLSGH